MRTFFEDERSPVKYWECRDEPLKEEIQTLV